MHFIELMIPPPSSRLVQHLTTGPVPPPLLFLHGLFGSSRTFGSLLQGLSARPSFQGRRLFALDLANHGDFARARLWRDDMSYRSMSRDVLSWLDWAGVESADVVGHSMGGKLAMAMALSDEVKGRVRKLAVLDIAPVDYREEEETSVYKAHRDLIDILLRAPFHEMTTRKEADKFLSPLVPNDNIRAFLMTNVEKFDGRMRLKVNINSISSEFDKISGFETIDSSSGAHFLRPTLFVKGEQSKFVLPKYQSAMRFLFPNHEVVTLQGAGHWLLDKPQLIDELEKFL